MNTDQEIHSDSSTDNTLITFNGYPFKKDEYGESEYTSLVKYLPKRIMDLCSRTERNLGSIGLRVKMIRQNPVSHFENAGNFAATFLADCMELLTTKMGLNTNTGSIQHVKRNLFLSNSERALGMITTIFSQADIGRPDLGVSIYTYADELEKVGYDESTLRTLLANQTVFKLFVHKASTEDDDYTKAPCLLYDNLALQKVYINTIEGTGKDEGHLPNVFEITTTYDKVMSYLMDGNYDETSEDVLPAQFELFRALVDEMLLGSKETSVKTKLWENLRSKSGGFVFASRPTSSHDICFDDHGMANWEDFSAKVLRKDSYSRPTWIPTSANASSEYGSAPLVTLGSIAEAGGDFYKNSMLFFENRSITEAWRSKSIYRDASQHTFETSFATYANYAVKENGYVTFQPNEVVIDTPDDISTNALPSRRFRVNEEQFMSFFVLADSIKLNLEVAPGSCEQLEEKLNQRISLLAQSLEPIGERLDAELKVQDNLIQTVNDLMNQKAAVLPTPVASSTSSESGSRQLSSGGEDRAVSGKDLALLLAGVMLNKIIN